MGQGLLGEAGGVMGELPKVEAAPERKTLAQKGIGALKGVWDVLTKSGTLKDVTKPLVDKVGAYLAGLLWTYTMPK